MKPKAIAAAVVLMVCVGGKLSAAPPEVPRIDWVEPTAIQPQQNDPATIWYDGFDNAEVDKRYWWHDDDDGDFVPVDYERYGPSGRAMRARWQQGEVDAGCLRLLIGANPAGPSVHGTEHFREIYWRLYVKHPRSWRGSPAKLSRATILANADLGQAMIAHVWHGGELLSIDPASGIDEGGQLITQCYNDFMRLQWMGNRRGRTRLLSASELGRWICVEAHARLNTPGQSDGIFTLTIDGKPEASRDDLNWVGAWDKLGINGVFLENWWNSGSPKEQERYLDNFVVSTKPVGPMVTSINPKVTKTAFADPDADDGPGGWEMEVAADPDGKDVVWRSRTLTGEQSSATVDAQTGTFAGTCQGRTALTPGTTCFLRLRQSDREGNWSDWSLWHSPFVTESPEKPK